MKGGRWDVIEMLTFDGRFESSGNVFIDLEYSPDEAASLQMRADLMAGLRKFGKARSSG